MANAVKRIHILGIPVDVVEDNDLPETINQLMKTENNRQIVFLDFHELMRARHNDERKRCLTQAALVVPISPIIARSARFLGLPVPEIRRPYPTIIRLLGILEQKNRSVYLLGSTMKDIRRSEARVRSSFPGLQIVGRYAARFPAEREKDVVTAIKKAAPSLLLAGKGLKGKHLWIARRLTQFSPGLSVWEKNCYEVFAGKRDKPNESSTHAHLTGFFSALVQPWRFFSGVPVHFLRHASGYRQDTKVADTEAHTWPQASPDCILSTMLNLRLLFNFINPRFSRLLLAILCILGLGVLLDTILILRISLLVGPWITMSFLSFRSALGLFISYNSVKNRGEILTEAVDRGHFPETGFSLYLSNLVAGCFLVVPGILNFFVGLAFLLPPVGQKIGDKIASLLGIDWQEAYEYLRLNRLS